MRLAGDIVEIGCFVGGGTAKLARFARPFAKRVIAVDLFKPEFDRTRNASGNTMSSLYVSFLEKVGMTQWEAFVEMTKAYDNIVVIRSDSKKIRFPQPQRFAFGFIDGCHEPDYTRNDFLLVWSHLVSGGAVAFDDYHFDLPQVTATVNNLIAEYSNEIAEKKRLPPKQIVVVKR